MIRQPIVAGQFYPARRDRLIFEIEKSFTCKIGPGLPAERKFHHVKGIIVPHAGYAYSGPCAAHGYRHVAEAADFDIFLLLGPNHTGVSGNYTATCLADWLTPLGTAVCDKEFAAKLIEETEVVDDLGPHTNEHSIEVQLPFLQFLFGNIKFVPLAVSHKANFTRLGSQIREIIAASGKKVCIVTSSDFTHYGPNYGFIPFTKNIKSNIEALDMEAIKRIQAIDRPGFQEAVKRTQATICGQHAISLLLEIIAKDVKDGHLLKYYQSGDILKDHRNSVSYASMRF
jgi:MEMO1 family protein